MDEYDPNKLNNGFHQDTRIETLEDRINFPRSRSNDSVGFKPVSRTIGTTYQAPANVWVYFSADYANSPGTVVLNFKTDTNSAPSTIVWRARYDTAHGNDSFSMTYFVPKGNYYIMAEAGGAGQGNIVYQEIRTSNSFN